MQCVITSRQFFILGSYLVEEGDPIDELIFMVSYTKDGERIGFFNCFLKPGDFFGEELLPWSLEAQASSLHPISTKTVEICKEVEGTALTANDLKSLLPCHFHALNPLRRKQLLQSLRQVVFHPVARILCLILYSFLHQQQRFSQLIIGEFP